MGPILDMCMTLLELGKDGLQKMLKERKELYEYTKEQLRPLLAKYGEQILENKDNKISIAISLQNLSRLTKKDINAFGAYLYTRRVSGIKVVAGYKSKTVCGIGFSNYGSHTEAYSQLPYMAFAVAVGCLKPEVLLTLFPLDRFVLGQTR